ncbi:MAG: hypothetical protein JNJ59_21315 [Deltaproteobacteria bacterium]|nr:hypothetical protein [Deltaproteobacteria bacterium]
MPPQSRVSDIGSVDADAHGCPACPHPAKGPIIVGSPNVFTNSLPTARMDDKGVHAACCGPNMFTASAGSGTVFVNGKKAHRKDDKQTHCGGTGKSIKGSPNVNTGG